MPNLASGAADLPSTLLPGVGPLSADVELAVRARCADGQEATSAAVESGERLRADMAVPLPLGGQGPLEGPLVVDVDAEGALTRVVGCTRADSGLSTLLDLRPTATGMGVTRQHLLGYECNAMVWIDREWMVGWTGLAHIEVGAPPRLPHAMGGWGYALSQDDGSIITASYNGDLSLWTPQGQVWAHRIGGDIAGKPTLQEASNVLSVPVVRLGSENGYPIKTLAVEGRALSDGALVNRARMLDVGPLDGSAAVLLRPTSVIVAASGGGNSRVVTCSYADGTCHRLWTAPSASGYLSRVEALPHDELLVTHAGGDVDTLYHLRPVAGRGGTLEAVRETRIHHVISSLAHEDGIMVVGCRFVSNSRSCAVGDVAAVGRSAWSIPSGHIDGLGRDSLGRIWVAVGNSLVRLVPEVR